MSLLLAAALLSGAAGLVVVLPILRRHVALLRDVTAGHIQDAEARKRVVLNELRELEYEYLAGKLDDTDYRDLKERLAAEAVVAMRAVEAVQARDAAPAIDAGPPRPVSASAGEPHACGFVNPAGSRFCAGCGARLR